MPAKSRRMDQCVYTEDNRRCRRSGAGNPALCQPHRLAFIDAVREEQAAQQPGGAFNGIYDLLGRFVNGQKVTRKNVEDALNDAARWVMENQAGAPPLNGPFRPPPGFHPPPGWVGAQGQQQQQQRRPPVDSKEIAARRARAQARIVLGFTPTEQLSEDVVKKRQRELAKTHHPDRGGDLSKMQAVNAAVDTLLQGIAG